MNKLIKLSRNFIILGIVLMIIAVIMNDGKIPLFANHYEEKHYVKLADNIKSINIDTVNVDVVVESSNSNNIEVSYFDSNISQYKITDNDGTLVIKEQDDNILKLNFNFITKKKDLIIKVPKKLVPELELSNNVGNVKLSNLSLTNATITSNVGNIKLEKLNITNLSVDNSAGNTVISDINSENGEFNINSQSGNINLTNLNNFNRCKDELDQAKKAVDDYRIAGQKESERIKTENDNRWAELERIAQEAELKYSGSREIQYIDNDAKVMVKSGYDRRHHCVVTDILITDRRSDNGLRLHLLIDENGKEIHRHVRDNKRRL